VVGNIVYIKESVFSLGGNVVVGWEVTSTDGVSVIGNSV